MKSLEFDSYYEVLALHKSLMAVKFDKNRCLPEAQGSPYTATLALKVFDLLVEFSKNEGKLSQADEWLAWQIADESRIETGLLLQHISNADWWKSSSEEQKEKYIANFMAPLKLNSKVKDEIIRNS